MSHRYLSGQIDRATHRTVLMRRFGSSLKAGVEINPGADEVGLVANWLAVTETESRPAVMFGTSSDRIGTPNGQSWFVTVSKSLESLPVAPYLSVSYSGHDDRLRFPFGLHAGIGDHWSVLLMNDGVHTHLGATVAWRRYSLTFLAVERRHPGLTLGTTF